MFYKIPYILISGVECECYGEPEKRGGAGPVHEQKADGDHLDDGLDLAHP